MANVTSQLFSNDGVSESVMNFTIQFFADLAKATVTWTVYERENINDTDCSKMIYKSSIEIDKILENTRGNMFVNSAMENMYKSLDFELKFPMRKVKFRCCVRLSIRHGFSGCLQDYELYCVNKIHSYCH